MKTHAYQADGLWSYLLNHCLYKIKNYSLTNQQTEDKAKTTYLI